MECALKRKGECRQTAIADYCKQIALAMNFIEFSTVNVMHSSYRSVVEYRGHT